MMSVLSLKKENNPIKLSASKYIVGMPKTLRNKIGVSLEDWLRLLVKRGLKILSSSCC